MGRMMLVLGAVVTLVFGMVLAPTVLGAVHDTATDAATDTFSGVTTGASETTKTVTLSKDHYHSDTTHITVSSDNANDSPTVDAYDPNTRQVTVGGLAASATRTLTVGYEVDALASYAGASSILGLIPLLFIVGLLALAGGMLMRQFR